MTLRLVVDNTNRSRSLGSCPVTTVVSSDTQNDNTLNKKPNLTEKIQEVNDTLNSLKEVLNFLYIGLNFRHFSPNESFGKQIYDYSFYPEKPFEFEEIVSQFYICDNDDYENPNDEDIELIFTACSLGMAEYVLKRSVGLKKEPEKSIQIDLLACFFYKAIRDNYQHPADFKLEYSQFRQWKLEEIDKLKQTSVQPNSSDDNNQNRNDYLTKMLARSFDFWTDCLWQYGVYANYLQRLIESKKMIADCSQDSLETAMKIKQIIEDQLI